MINYTEKGYGLHAAIGEAGHKLEQRDGVWTSSDDEVVQAIIDSYNPLPSRKLEKISELKVEGLKRVQILFPAISNFDELDLVREQYLTVAPVARTPTISFQTLIDIVLAGNAAAADINNLATEAEVIGYDVVNTPVWGA